MSALLPLLVAAPTVTGVAGYMARGMRRPIPATAGGRLDSLPGPAPVPVHRPYVEYFDLAELSNTDARGFVRPVECFHVEPWGLYLARIIDRTHFLQSWLLPELSLRATLVHARPGCHASRDYRLEIGEYSRIAPRRWKAVDHYLAVVVRGDQSAELRGVDELLAAHSAGLVSAEQCRKALADANAALHGLAAHDYDVRRWLAAHGVALTWM
ncbi:hypothetical protein [Nocardia sp. NPDC048505]|uniref:DUF402 domain-containing protein n=1 Tax=unclassified Nocardia TaxID=2637762 RepID=UPI0033D40F40